MTYQWDFGDSSPLDYRQKPAHSYKQSGEYIVSLIVKDPSGLECNTDKDNCIITVNEFPKASMQIPNKGCPNQTLSFDASSSEDLDGKIINYEWNLGDGTTKEGVKIKHNYEKAGKYKIILKVTDNTTTNCNTNTISDWVIINDKPIAKINAPVRGAQDEILTFSANKSYDKDGKIISYEWDFGDGSRGEGNTQTHSYSNAGYYDVILTVRDNSELECNTDKDRLTVFINTPPIANAGGPYLTCDGIIDFDGSLSKDNDGEIILYQWNSEMVLMEKVRK